MNIDAEIWTPGDDEDGDLRSGEVLIEVVGDEEIVIHFRVDGEIVANALIDRFKAGLLAGHLEAGAAEAVKA